MTFWKRDKRAWSLASVQPPWDPRRTSIRDHIAAHLGADGRVTEAGQTLPDEPDDNRLRWIPGGLDGAFGHHGNPGGARDQARLIHRALGVVLDNASDRKLETFYDQLLAGSALECVDPLIERVLDTGDLDPERLEALALWLATLAPDREPVKIAIALLGLVPGSDHIELLMTLGRHEELTLYAAVALGNAAGEDAERHLFELARAVDGWGRIQIVERLAETDDPEIKAWMLRDGYRNDVMFEYLAYTCAVAGELCGALEADSIDPALLDGAGDIIAALIAGGPAATPSPPAPARSAGLARASRSTAASTSSCRASVASPVSAGPSSAPACAARWFATATWRSGRSRPEDRSAGPPAPGPLSSAPSPTSPTPTCASGSRASRAEKPRGLI